MRSSSPEDGRNMGASRSAMARLPQHIRKKATAPITVSLALVASTVRQTEASDSESNQR